MASFKQTFETITSSKIFQQFKQEHPEAKLCAGFFILDFLSNDTKNTLDYMEGEKVFTFQLFDNKDIVIEEDKLINPENK